MDRGTLGSLNIMEFLFNSNAAARTAEITENRQKSVNLVPFFSSAVKQKKIIRFG